MRRTTASIFAVFLLALGACRETGGEGEFFTVSGRLFVFNYRVATVTYLVTLKPLQPMEGDQTAVASFEDPAGGPAIVVRQKVWPQLAFVTLQSPPLRCVRKDRPYAVSIRIEDAGGAGRQTIETTMASSQDQDVLPERPLVVGPFYTPNPEVAGLSGAKLGNEPPKSACPA